MSTTCICNPILSVTTQSSWLSEGRDIGHRITGKLTASVLCLTLSSLQQIGTASASLQTPPQSVCQSCVPLSPHLLRKLKDTSTLPLGVITCPIAGVGTPFLSGCKSWSQTWRLFSYLLLDNSRTTSSAKKIDEILRLPKWRPSIFAYT